MECSTDYRFPMVADVYFPITDAGLYGNVEKRWVYDRTVVCSLTEAGAVFKEQINANVNITQEKLLVGRVKEDIRVSEQDGSKSLTNVLITNIKDKHGNEIYLETVGPRSGRSTIFEVASQDPYINPFGTVEFHKLVVRRAENQAADV